MWIRTPVFPATQSSGLPGPALDFAYTLLQEIQDNAAEFSQRLIEQFPHDRKVVDKSDLWRQAGEEDQTELARAWVSDRNDQYVGAAVRTRVITYKEVTMPDTITLIEG
ncbi:hypothetical protein N7516_002642 [Penicillium verrucosum]|uniref:uncharacterized protein n=1 Tax=Penicillium verrucosum TaxID=60171 RepID=UPI002545B270|nr:uncharacterized protein N7516_002642 [Penicillium verrucosum]KAJ5942474.1 hypothetical protein N7516_002642 [Penicillium verrucosum]